MFTKRRGTGILGVRIVEMKWTHENSSNICTATAKRNKDDLFWLFGKRKIYKNVSKDNLY